MSRVFVSLDTSALALGAERVAQAIAAEAKQRGAAVEIVRNGSRGLFWLEPLVEVEAGGQRLAYGPVAPRDVASLFEAGFLAGGAHALALGPTQDIAYLARQERLTFARVGLTDPLSLDDYRAHGGWRGLENALALAPAAIVREVTDSGLRGRGGAASPPAPSGKRCAVPGRSKNTSFATPTKATRAPSPTAC